MSLEKRSIYQLLKESNIKNLGNLKIQQVMHNPEEWLQLLGHNQDMLLQLLLLNDNSQDILQLLLNKNTWPPLPLKLNPTLVHTWARRNYSQTLLSMRNMPRDRNQIYYF